MAGISSGGIGSGLDVATIVQQLVSADRAPTDARHDRTSRQLQAQISAIGTLRSSFSSLRTAVAALSSKDAAQARKVTLPADNNFTATATAGSAVGQFQVEVRALASSQRVASGAFAKADTVVGTGTLTLTAGETTLSVEIGAGKNTLAGIRDAINATAGGKTVTASIVTGDDGAHLVLNAVDSGSAGALKIAASGGDGGLSALAYQPPAATQMTVAAPATDAIVKVDGIERTSSSNTLTDLIGGVSLTLTKAEPGTTRELKIASDPSAQRSSAKSFVNAYNGAMGAIGTTTAYNTSTQVAAALNGDAMVRGASRELRDIVSDNITDLKSLGITINKDGTLKLDEATFDAAVAKDPGVAARLFGSGDGTMAFRLDAALDRLLDDGGMIDSRSDGLENRTRSLQKQRDALDFRMTQVEARYRAQFTALDAMVTKLQNTSNFLSQQLSSL
ncbi:flagellar filament capping protein FliD [Agrilutibacter solisilvae]|uniref:Flagellar hook-associated protein 2 n=1 Tax=Agrilutibacter solisilvae TaxID=2763317 RepID=A0A975ARG0_9GAMM|nr:flagellar filament capping protein FliD [Lysobacter solisilvae]QSX77617.1 flagellar filament capping protein FliD [Lysobacter solisilvae]